MSPIVVGVRDGLHSDVPSVFGYVDCGASRSPVRVVLVGLAVGLWVRLVRGQAQHSESFMGRVMVRLPREGEPSVTGTAGFE